MVAKKDSNFINKVVLSFLATTVLLFFRNLREIVPITQGTFLEKMAGKFVVITKNITIDEIKHAMLSENGYLHDIVKLIIIRQRSEDTWTFFERQGEKQDQLGVANIWKNGGFLWNIDMKFKNELEDHSGKILRASSFDLPPMIYKTHPSDNTYENGYEVCKSKSEHVNKYLKICTFDCTINCHSLYIYRFRS